MTRITSVAESSSAAELFGKTILSIFHDYGAPLFVWGVWALMLLTALTFVGTYSANVPIQDDYAYVVALTGEQPITVSWLWAQVDTHRIPLPKLILVGLYRLSGDFRAAMFFNVLALGALAFTMIWIARRLRGQMSYSDAFFPLVLLHPGHPYLLWSLLIQIPTVLAGVLLLIIVVGDVQLRWGAAILAGICLVLLPLCGGNGLLLVPPLALWLSYIGVQYWRSREPHGKRNSLLILGLASSALLLTALYLHGLQQPGDRRYNFGILTTINISILFIAQGFGPAYLIPLERFLGWRVALWTAGLGVAGLLLFSTVALVTISRKRPLERPRALGLLLFLGAMLSLALAIGYGRGGLMGHYVILAVPALCCVYFVWSIYGPPTAGFIVRNSLFLYSFILLIFNFNEGVQLGKYVKYINDDLHHSLMAGLPNCTLSNRGSPLFVHTTKGAHHGFAMLHRAGLGEFRLMREDPVFREVSLPISSAAFHRMTWEEGTARGAGADSYLVFTLPKATFVGGIRFKYSHSSRRGGAPEPFLISWKRDEQHSFTEAQGHLSSQYGEHRLSCQAPQEETVMEWVGDSLKQFRIRPDPDRPDSDPVGIFRISEVVLLVPVDEQFDGYAGEDHGYGEALRSPRATIWSKYAVWPVRIRDTLKVFLRDVISRLKGRGWERPFGRSPAQIRTCGVPA